MTAARGQGGEAEAKRVLERIARESEAGGGSATHAEQPDPIEKLGLRIGRTLALALTVALMVWLAGLVFGFG